jgi:hypothetical protein
LFFYSNKNDLDLLSIFYPTDKTIQKVSNTVSYVWQPCTFQLPHIQQPPFPFEFARNCGVPFAKMEGGAKNFSSMRFCKGIRKADSEPAGGKNDTSQQQQQQQIPSLFDISVTEIRVETDARASIKESRLIIVHDNIFLHNMPEEFLHTYLASP